MGTEVTGGPVSMGGWRPPRHIISLGTSKLLFLIFYIHFFISFWLIQLKM